ncbi:MAG: MlaD family protein, partial [bacterium]|nr:MlaD family protein [bacterium]MDW8163545.1 MlaD family protein [Candidatus Omnitrophota bacterium]
MEKKFTDEMKVGLFVFSAIICIIFFIFTQTRIGKWAGYEIGVLFDFVSGLEIGSPVRVSGVRVGEVKKIEIIYQETPKVFVKLKIHPTVRIGRNSRFTIRTLGLIGEKYIEIVPSKGEDFIKRGEIVEGENPLSVEKIANMGEEIATNLNKVLSDISKITGDKKFQQSINEVLENTKLALVQINNSFSKIDNLVEDISQTNKNINSFIEENSPGIKKVIENTNSFLVSGK